MKTGHVTYQCKEMKGFNTTCVESSGQLII